MRVGVCAHIKKNPNIASSNPAFECSTNFTQLEMSLSSWCGLFLAFVLLESANSAASNECKSYDERSKVGGRPGTADRKVVCSNMELQQVLPVTSFPNRTVTL